MMKKKRKKILMHERHEDSFKIIIMNLVKVFFSFSHSLEMIIKKNILQLIKHTLIGNDENIKKNSSSSMTFFE